MRIQFELPYAINCSQLVQKLRCQLDCTLYKYNYNCVVIFMLLLIYHLLKVVLHGTYCISEVSRFLCEMIAVDGVLGVDILVNRWY